MPHDSQQDLSSRKTSVFEITVIIIVLFFSIALFWWMSHGGGHRPSEATSAAIYVGDQLLEEVDLKGNRLIMLPVGEMQVEVKDGQIRVASSDCPKKICVNTGWIRTPGQVIVCVPYKVLIEISAKDSSFLDAVVR